LGQRSLNSLFVSGMRTGKLLPDAFGLFVDMSANVHAEDSAGRPETTV
jgi:hypothetical protein